MEMLALWGLYRGNGMGGGHLPGAGGSGDQAAIMIDAFRVMDGAWSKLEEEEDERKRAFSAPG